MEWSKFHKGSHPLLLIFLAPFSLLKVLSPFVSISVLAVMLNSFFGAVGVGLASLFFIKLTQKYLDALLLTCVFGFSMSQVFFSSLLESYTFACCSIITTYLLFIICLRNKRVYWGYWILAGLFSFGVTITNFAQTLICFILVVFFVQKQQRVSTVLEYTGAIFSISFVLSIIQEKLLNGKYFFVPGTVGYELTFINKTIISHPISVTQELIKHFLLVNFVSSSPFPEAIVPGEKIVLSFVERPLNYTLIGLIATMIWLLIFIWGTYKNVSSFTKFSQENKVFFMGVVLINLSNIALYSIFDTAEMFLFTCNFTFSVLLLLINKNVLEKKYMKAAIITLIFIMGINNMTIMNQIINA